MYYAGDWSGYLEINRPSWNKGFRGSHDIILITEFFKQAGGQFSVN